MDERGNKARHLLGDEHFPECKCFTAPEHAETQASSMYDFCREVSTEISSHLLAGAVCERALPYYIALIAQMMVSHYTSHKMYTEHGDEEITPGGMVEFAARQRVLVDKISERLEALMKRAEKIAHGGKGDERVH